MFDPRDISRFTVITGHYGTGKTNFAINLALDLAEKGERVTVVDLDVVNPYFRSSDYTRLLTERGIRIIAPTFAGSTLDSPALPAAIDSAFSESGYVIVDAGGDDAGAAALGRYAKRIVALEHDVLYVVNKYRVLTPTAADTVGILADIEAMSRLKATGVVNNSHLRDQTTIESVLTARDFGTECANLLGIPLVCTTIPVSLVNGFSDDPDDDRYVEKAYPLRIHVLTPWEEPPRFG